MAHHNFEPDDEQKKILESIPFTAEGDPITDRLRALEDRLGAATDKLGPTGKFPDGELGDNDDGEFRYRVGDMDGRVIVDFGAPVHSLGLLPEQADEFADCLKERAAICRRNA